MSRTPPTTVGLEAPRAAASATHLAVMPAGMGDDGVRHFRLLAGPLEGALTPLNDSIVWIPALLDWSGSVLIAREGDRAGMVLSARDASASFAARQLPLDPGVRALEAAGSHIASLTTVGQIGGTEEQIDARIDVASVDGEPEFSITAEDSFISDFAVQADGKVAWLERRHVASRSATLAWASPAEPWPHVMARDVPIEGMPIGLGGDRLVFGRRATPRRGSWQPWVSDLASTARPTWFDARRRAPDPGRLRRRPPRRDRGRLRVGG